MSKNQMKADIRQVCLEQRKGLSSLQQSMAAEKICTQIELLPQYQNAHSIGLYIAMNGEVNLANLWQSQHLQKVYFFPVMKKKSLVFLPATSTTPFVKNKWGVAEPCVPTEPYAKTLDIIFMPLVAFDNDGTRIGMGSGYYDRSLVNFTESLLIGIGYDFQKQDHIDPDPWDIRLDAVITESAVSWFTRP